MRLLLASGSEWRQRLLSWFQVPFEVVESGVDESLYESDDSGGLVATLATAKAGKVAGQLMRDWDGEDEDALVIGADTVIVLDGEVIGKPADQEEAREMIQRLQGRTHQVLTGVCVVNVTSGERRVEVERTKVSLHPMNEKEIERYLKSNDWQGKAGSYQILGEIGKYVELVDESVTNVIGLPLGLLQEMMSDLGMDVEVNLRQVVEQETGYGK